MAEPPSKQSVACSVKRLILSVVHDICVNVVEQTQSLGDVPLLAEGGDISAVYAARKKQRRDKQRHPREFDSSIPASFVSGSPSRPIVNSQRVHRLPQSMTHQATIMDQWSPHEWRSHVRMQKHLFLWLLDNLESAGNLISRDPGTGGKPVRPGWCQLGAVLSWLGGARPVDLWDKYGMRNTCFQRCRQNLVHAIREQFGHFVAFPTPDQYDKVAEEFESYCKFGGVIGALDGLIVPCKLPRADLRCAMYCERKAVYGYNVQAACDAHCVFTFVNVGHFASCHDGRAIKETPLWQRLEAGLLGEHFLIGDNAYPLRSFLLHPWKGVQVGSAADSFNYYLSAARSSIERAFGILCLEFPVLKHGLQMQSVDDTVAAIHCCFILHNLRHAFNDAEFPTPFPTRGGNVNSEMSDVNTAVQYVRSMGDDQIGERTASDRHTATEEDVIRAKSTRVAIAHDLRDRGLFRRGCEPDWDSPCPDERLIDSAGLI